MSERRKILELFDNQKEQTEKRVSEGIEKYRKGDMQLTITDNDGNPIPNVLVKVNQIDHEFRFGANIFMLDQFETDEKNAKYKQYFCDVFNIATLPFYWSGTEPQKGHLRYDKNSTYMYRRPPIDACMEFCFKNGIEPREHALAYELHFPDWLKGLSNEQIMVELERRYQEISTRYADKINTIEVTNEMCWWEGKTDFYNYPDYVEWCFKLAEKYFPNNQLAINEYAGEAWERANRTSIAYYSYIENALLKGARIDAIGMQYHIFLRKEDEYERSRLLLDPQNLFDKMDLYSRFGKPLQVTEITVPAYSWEDENEQIQAEILETLYKIWFSHPNMEQIIYWNLVDGYAHVNSPDPEVIKNSQGDMTIGENYYHGGLFRFDMTPKPAYNTIKNLIKNVWHTGFSVTTNSNGTLSSRGFYGKYSVEINYNGKTITKYINHLKATDGKYVVKV